MNRITITPDPQIAGNWVLVCYDVSGGVTLPLTLAISTGSSTVEDYDHEITLDEPCFQMWFPADSYGMTVTDESGQSEPASVSPVV